MPNPSTALRQAAVWAILSVLATAEICLAQSSPKLRYVAVAPCRILDTRPPHIRLVANATTSFRALGAGSLSAQGGSATGCGLPDFDPTNAAVRAIAVNLVAVSPDPGGGYLKAWAADQPEPPTAVLTFQNADFPISNQVTLALRTTGLATDLDFNVKAVRGTDLVGDVVGYYATESFLSARSAVATVLPPLIDTPIPLETVDQASGFVGNTAGFTAQTAGRYAVHFGVLPQLSPPTPMPLVVKLLVNSLVAARSAVPLGSPPTPVERSTVVTLQAGDFVSLAGAPPLGSFVILDAATTGTSAWMVITQID